jgi:hypothetical protein
MSGASDKPHDVERRFEGEECVDLGRSGDREKFVSGGAKPIPTGSAQEFRQVVGRILADSDDGGCDRQPIRGVREEVERRRN